MKMMSEGYNNLIKSYNVQLMISHIGDIGEIMMVFRRLGMLESDGTVLMIELAMKRLKILEAQSLKRKYSI